MERTPIHLPSVAISDTAPSRFHLKERRLQTGTSVRHHPTQCARRRRYKGGTTKTKKATRVRRWKAEFCLFKAPHCVLLNYNRRLSKRLKGRRHTKSALKRPRPQRGPPHWHLSSEWKPLPKQRVRVKMDAVDVSPTSILLFSFFWNLPTVCVFCCATLCCLRRIPAEAGNKELRRDLEAGGR